MSKFYIPNEEGEKDCPECDGACLIDGEPCNNCNGMGKVSCNEDDAWNNYVNECESISDANKDEKE